jgi:hypothetical protein
MNASAFRTIVTPEAHPAPLAVGQTVLSAGSCFADVIAERLRDNRFAICANPFGTVYNPLSLCVMFERILDKRYYERAEIFEHQGLWKSFDHHSSFNAPSPETLLQTVNAAVDTAYAALVDADHILLTFGTAFVYRLQNSGRVAANCHRLPHDRFERRLAAADAIIERCAGLFDRLAALPRRPKCILTVSPVRHLRDRPAENSLSKAHCIIAAHRLCDARENLYYFPAYELLLDDLRDYRFYAEDLTHPSRLAVDYIWQRFAQSCLDASAREFIAAYEPVRKARAHRIDPTAIGGTRRFARQMLAKVETIAARFPQARLEDDREYFRRLL